MKTPRSVANLASNALLNVLQAPPQTGYMTKGITETGNLLLISMEITLSHIHKSFVEGRETRTILTDLSVCFPSGKFSVILGKSGSGKSTILNLISGIDTPDRGEIIIGESDIGSLSDYHRTLFRRRSIGFIFQFFNLIPTLTVLENVMLIPELDGKKRKQTEQRAMNLLEMVGLADRRNTSPDNLSGGEQQRTAIARAFVHAPEIILADEPTGNLDADTGTSVLDMMLTLTREQGKTMIMATHSSEMLKAADSVYSISDRKLIQVDKP